MNENLEFKLPNDEVVKISDLLETYMNVRFRPKKPGESEILYNLRKRRQYECFNVIDNRSELWFNELSDAQYAELKKWRQDWLDVTDNRVPPIAPVWLNKKLEGEDII